ncbi:hypothetical protein AB9E14_06365 [Rhizobium leguminosarum]|uniref:hypothetical protein n=1 Tax=Rhizobium leguminosarum TaxID=384 RepID=UPI003F9C3CDE
MSNERDAYWQNEALWPDDAYGFVFLARALHAAGASLYGDAWTREEPTTPPPLDLWQEINGHKFLKPRKSVGNAMEMQVLRLLQKYHPDKVELEDAPLKRSDLVNRVMTEESWRAATKVVEEENARRQGALDRLGGAQDLLKVAIRDGKLRYVLLPLVGGRFSEAMPPEWWNRKSLASIFFWCQINPDNPFTIGVGGDNFQYVFVDGIDLNLVTKYRDEGFDLPDFSGVRDFADRPQPRPDHFAVMDMDDWSIEMVLAWILWRDPVQVVRFDRDFHKALTVDECIFDTIPAPTLGGLQELLQTQASVDDISFDVAFRRLRAALRSGNIVADATHLASMDSLSIPAEQWKRLVAVPDVDQRTVLANGFNVAMYGDVWLDRKSVMRLWPADADEPPMEAESAPIFRSPMIESEPEIDVGKPRRTKQRLVKRALDLLFPDGRYPDASEMTNAALIEKVGKVMMEQKEKNSSLEGPPSNDTILRAAGRK